MIRYFHNGYEKEYSLGTMFKVLFKNLVLLLVIGAAAFIFRVQLERLWTEALTLVAPCSQPIEYSLGNLDTRFGVSKSDFLAALVSAEAIWEKPLDRDLFVYVDTGALKVNLVYDNRQAATEKLKDLGLVVKDNKASYDAVKQKYSELNASYLTKKATYEAHVASLATKSDAYKAEVASWNEKGGAPRDVYARLNAEKLTLAEGYRAVQAEEVSIRALVDSLNAVVDELNRLASLLNIKVDQFNSVAGARGNEFTEGLYTSDASGQRIDIYEFNTKAQLVRVLAHELGHALGLDHVEDPKAIMYKINESTNEKLTDADITELKSLCKID